MRIGIVTFWQSRDNYGQILQCYALQKYLSLQGHDAFLIRYEHDNVRVSKSIYKKIIKVLLIYPIVLKFIRFRKDRFYKKEKLMLYDKNLLRKFDEFRNNYIKQSLLSYKCLANLKKNPPDADCYIVGSDQVWAKLLNTKENYIFYLDFGSDAVRRVSYAASFSMLSYPQQLQKQLQKQLAKFDYISVRESAGVDICRRVGYQAELVLDPTLLLGCVEYTNFIKRPNYDFDYVYVYVINILHQEEIHWDALNSIVLEKKMKIVVTPSSGYFSAKELFSNVIYSYASIEDWLANIYYSKFVITTSFHGVIFSVILNKNFVYFPIEGQYSRGNNRVETFLKLIGLDYKIMDLGTTLVDVLNKDIDWEHVNCLIKKMRRKSVNFLNESLS